MAEPAVSSVPERTSRTCAVPRVDDGWRSWKLCVLVLMCISTKEHQQFPAHDEYVRWHAF